MATVTVTVMVTLTVVVVAVTGKVTEKVPMAVETMAKVVMASR